MTTAAQYQHKVQELDLDALKSGAESQVVQASVDTLRQIEQDIQREIRVIQIQYQSRIDAANRGGSSQIMASNRQMGSERRRADQVEKLETERDAKIQPYQEVLDQVMEHIRGLENPGAA